MKLCTRIRKRASAAQMETVRQKNARMADAFAQTAFAERIVLVPHCMRSIEKCGAKEMGSHYLCLECGRCKIASISKKSRDLGYRALFILKGGRAVEQLMKEHRPAAVLGVACDFEGALAMEQAEKGNVVVQFVRLTKDGCVGTDVDLESVFAMLERKK